ncbi:MAG TPA: N-acetylglucosamine kinase [Arachidicoccus sp.]
MPTILIADSGATKCSWVLLHDDKKKSFTSQGINPYHLSEQQLTSIIATDVLPKIKTETVDEIYFYGAGMFADKNKRMMKKIFSKIFPQSKPFVDTDLTASARATCGSTKGVISILGTGSGVAYFNGNKIAKVQNGIGYILGDEGSGSYLGRKVIQYFLYNTFDDELMHHFNEKYTTSRDQILDNVYHQPFPGRYLAAFTSFLSEHRGHYMIENIIEDGLNDFIVTHIYKFREAWLYPLHFTGGVAFAFKDVLKELCSNYELEFGNIIQYPIEELIKYHQQ